MSSVIVSTSSYGRLTTCRTLQGMFPDLDKDVISDVVRMKEGRVGLAVDACLALNN